MHCAMKGFSMPTPRCTVVTCMFWASLLVAAGCDSHDDANQNLTDMARWWAKEEIKRIEGMQLSKEKDRLEADYLLKRYKATAEFMADKQSLERPYTVCAQLAVAGPADEFGGWLAVEWVEDKTHALGVVLVFKRPEGFEFFKVPLFGHEKWDDEARDRRGQNNGWRTRTKSVAITADGNIGMRLKNMKTTDKYDPVLQLPRTFLSHPIELAVYDLEGRAANFIPVYVMRGEAGLP